MSPVKINGVELDLDLLDADVMEKFEKTNKEIVEKIQEPTQYDGKTAAEGMRIQCRYIDKFFDDLFGEGTADKLFGGGNNLGVRMDAFGAVVEQSTLVKDQIKAISGKYTIARLSQRA